MTTAVLFDMDGVLVDSEPIINAAAIRALAEFGITARPEDFQPFVGAGEDRYVGGVAELHGQTYVPEMKHRTYDWYLKLLPEHGQGVSRREGPGGASASARHPLRGRFQRRSDQGRGQSDDGAAECRSIASRPW